ncbi:MAG: gliding motility-associated C-terminal domain-containing protein [Bacteroidota bacterium]
MIKSFIYISLTLSYVNAFSQLFISESALLHVAEGAELQVEVDLQSEGAIQNLGTITLFGDWLANNNFNGSEGELKFAGGEDQMILAPELVLKELTIESSGSVTFPGDQYTILEKIDFQLGIIEAGEDTRFVLGEDIAVLGGSNESYFSGSIIAKGSGNKIFPVGDQGVYAPLTLENVFGSDIEIQTSYVRDNPVDPQPGDSLLGVSQFAYWNVELIGGATSRPAEVRLEFNEEDLSDFVIRNNIRFRESAPAVAFTEQLVNRWQSLGVSEIIDSDSLTFGNIKAAIPISLASNQQLYFAVALAPIAPSNGLVYIPEVFSPNASDPDNKSFKIFGQKIVDENFDLQIFNKLGVRVYQTSSFSEANQSGWNGTNPSGGDEPTGVYYYTLRLTFERGQEESRQGAFYLVR